MGGFFFRMGCCGGAWACQVLGLLSSFCMDRLFQFVSVLVTTEFYAPELEIHVWGRSIRDVDLLYT